jgi:SAM-dependent methyltransferase
LNANKNLWEKGDFTVIARTMRESGEEVVRSLNVRQHMHVLDLGCGDGTTAIPLAKTGERVTGIDIASNLVAAGRRRIEEHGLTNISLYEGDAGCLEGEADDSFDLTLSMFGAMFSPSPLSTASEMVRVTRSGGTIVMGNWIPNDPESFVSQLLRVSAAYMPPPPEGFVSPVSWGVETHILERFAAAGIPAGHVTTQRDTYHFRAPWSAPEQFVDCFRLYYGPTMNAFEAASKQGREAQLHADLLDLAREHNRCSDGGTHICAAYMRVTVQVP